MRKKLFVDTSYFPALLNSRDEFHRHASIWADRIDAQLITTEAILTEIGNALAKPQWRTLAVDTLNDLREDEDVEILPINPDLFSKALQLYSSRMDKDWGLTDCLSFVVMKDRELTDALTTDHHFEQATMCQWAWDIAEGPVPEDVSWDVSTCRHAGASPRSAARHSQV